MRFHGKSPIIKYCQNILNSCFSSSLASAFDSFNQTKDSNAIEIRIEESLKIQLGDCIYFVNVILKNEKELTVNRNCVIA